MKRASQLYFSGSGGRNRVHGSACIMRGNAQSRQSGRVDIEIVNGNARRYARLQMLHH